MRIKEQETRLILHEHDDDDDEQKLWNFSYVGNLVSCEEEVDFDSKMNNNLKITGIINNTFRAQNTLKKTRMKLRSTLTLPAVLYCSENWTIKARDARRITAAEMKCIRTTSRIQLYRS